MHDDCSMRIDRCTVHVLFDDNIEMEMVYVTLGVCFILLSSILFLLLLLSYGRWCVCMCQSLIVFKLD